MIIHTVILCLFLDFSSNMVILPQDGLSVKRKVEKQVKSDNGLWRIK